MAFVALFALDFAAIQWLVAHPRAPGPLAAVWLLASCTMVFLLVYYYVPPKLDEVLIVILIVALLVGLLLPGMRHTRHGRRPPARPPSGAPAAIPGPAAQ